METNRKAFLAKEIQALEKRVRETFGPDATVVAVISITEMDGSGSCEVLVDGESSFIPQIVSHIEDRLEEMVLDFEQAERQSSRVMKN